MPVTVLFPRPNLRLAQLSNSFSMCSCTDVGSVAYCRNLELKAKIKKIMFRNRPISVYRLGAMPIQSCGQNVIAPRGKAGARMNAHTELRTKRQRSAPEAIYRNRPI